MSGALDIAIADVRVVDRLRDLDPDWAALLAESIKDIGLKHPILVARSGEKYRLVVGLHRLEAMKLLQREKIAAEIVEGDKLHQRLTEIDENLMRRELSALDRGAFLSERQAIHLELHPETAKGKAGAEARWHALANLSFASEVSEKLGISARSIRRAMRRNQLIDREVRSLIASTWIADSGVDLDALSRLPPKDQRRAVERMLRSKDPCGSVTQALHEINGAPKPTNDGFAKLVSAWSKADKRARNEFLAHLDKAGALAAYAEGRKPR
jgi:ParB family chromosome partitioning protein